MNKLSPSALNLLEPGALLGGALMRSLFAETAPEPELPVNSRVGPFRILAPLGAGGMGVVYLAARADGQFEQQVAIKCVRTAGNDALNLFRRERQILAEIRHPHIARLLDGGQLEDGRLWFAMELVEGARIDLHVRDQKLSVDARLSLLRQANAAVSFAHQRLLLHRDIKPGNVLIDADGGVKLLDFGIAALVGDDQATRAYSPAWASPEQLGGREVGPASDLYQLGLLMDALLQEQGAATPAPAATVLPDRNAAASGAARHPARQWLRLPPSRSAELRAIFARATAADVADRYGSVAEFDADLGRWLRSRPVAAHGAGIGYTLRCAIRRHRWLTVAIVSTVIGIIGLVIGFSWRLALERDFARAQAERATREAQTAAAISRFLQDDLLALADPNLSQDVDLKVQTLLTRAAGGVDQRLAQQPLIALQIHLTLGRSLRGLGALQPAVEQFELAEALAAKLLTPDDPQRLWLALWRGDLELARSEPKAAYARLQQVTETAARTLGADSQLALEAAVRAQAARFELGEQVPALDALRALLPRLDKALGADSPLSIFALNRLAIMYNSVEKTQDSERVRAEHLLRATRVYGADHSTTLTGRLNRAVLLRKLGRTSEALSEALAAEAGLRRVFGSPSIAVLHALNVRSRILADSNRVLEAIALQRETLAGRVALLGEWHDDVAFSHVNLGGMLMQVADYSAACVEYERALAIRLRLLPPEHVDVITNLMILADAQRQSGQLEAAAANGELAVKRARANLAADRPERGAALYRYAQILQARRKPDQARAVALESIAVYQHTLTADHPRMLALQQLAALPTARE